jgi:uncharacterized repeat protein (TIGR01451 family)
VPTAVTPVMAQTPAANPPIAEQCGLPMTLVLDASGSISSAGAVETVRDAAEVFLDAVKDTGSTTRVIDFGTFSRVTAGAELVTTDSMAPGGVHANAIAAYYNPRPPVTPPATGARQYDGSGSLSDPGNFGGVTNDNQWTNWDSALDRADDNPGELVVFVTDGDPTAINLDQPGDAFNPPGTTVAYNTFRGSGAGPSVDRAVAEANLIKTAGGGADAARILAVGVGAAVTQDASVERLTQIAGPQVVRDASTVTSLNQVDVAVVPDFDDLAALLKRVVTELCSPSLAVRKFVQSAGSTNYVPAPGWDITVDPGVPGDSFRWIQPRGAPVPQTVTTNNNGFANFQWEPDPPTLSSDATVTEELQPNFVGGPATCEILPPEGEAEFLQFPDSSEPLSVPVGPQDIVTCALHNNFDYQPGIDLVKTPDPTVVRGDDDDGDGERGNPVTYTGVVTNTGNTPLVLSEGDDSNCHDIELISGDTNDNGKLDVDEEWTFQCTRVLQSALTQEDVFVDNTAFVVGVDPAGTQVEAEDDASVQVLTPAINLEKEVDQPEVAPGTEVTYTFTVTNLGNDPLSAITLADSNPECVPVLVSGDTNTNTVLDLTETWIYECTVLITGELGDPTLNQATVTGMPTIGPDVSDPANAEVNVVYEDMNLDKTVDRNVVFIGDTVTYTYVVSNPAADPLTPVPPATRDDVVTDANCEDVIFVGSNIPEPNDQVLSEGEEWTYTCMTEITETTLNIGSATMEGPLGPITREDPALVVPVPTGIQIVKTPSDDLVRSGTDVTYTYEVSNTGLAPIADVMTGVTDDFCSPVTFVEGDTDGDELLDVQEVWIFTCTATLTESTTNTATVTGTPELPDGTPGDPVTDDDPATVDVFTPAIELVKTVSEEFVRVGSLVTYTYVATNTGDIELVPLGIVDNRCTPLEFVGGDPEGDGRMAPGEAWTWTCSKRALVDTRNTAVIAAVDPSGETVTDDDDARVRVFDSDINLEKTADPILVPEGGTTTFTFEVTNPGPVPLSNVTLTDDTCSRPPRFVGGDTNGDNRLAPNNRETWIFTCTAPITEFTSNTAEVTGTDPGGFRPRDIGVAGALPYRPGIAVTKTATPTSVSPGGTVTYRYEVVNTGNIPLADVKNRITDDTCSPVTFVSGDSDGNELLTGDTHIYEISIEAETWVFTCTTTVSEDTTNTVTVEGVPSDLNGDPIGPPVDSSDTATVDVAQAPTPTTSAPTTPAPTPTLPATGNSGLAAPLTAAATLLLAGAAMVSVARWRRRSVV